MPGPQPVRLRLQTLEGREVPASLPNVGRGLNDLLTRRAAGQPPADPTLALDGDTVRVTARSNGDFAPWLARLEALGFRPTATAPKVGLAEGYLPIDQVEAAAALPGTRSVLPTFALQETDAQGSVANGAEVTMRTALATRLFGATGAGVTVGVISDSANRVGGGLADSRATGNLPPAPQSDVLLDGPAGSSDEGRAMMELIHDLAPGARLRFASGSGGDAGMANAINILVAAGCAVIVDDLNGLGSEPYLQDGLAAQAVDAAVARGVTYLGSQGNRGTGGYETVFRGTAGTVGGVAGRFHDFDPGPGVSLIQTLTVQPGDSSLVLHFDDPFYGGPVTHDVEVVATNADGSLRFVASDDNVALGDPREFFFFRNSTGAPVDVGLSVRAKDGGDIGYFKYIGFNGLTVKDHLTARGAIHTAANPTHSGAVGTISVAAAPNSDPTTGESFSAIGPVTRVFSPTGLRRPALEVRNTPTLTAIDGVATSVPGFGTFFGTSASAPDAAAVAALALQFKPGLSPARVRSALIAGTVDIGDPGYDLVTGHGVLDAAAVLVGLNGGTLPITGDVAGANQADAITLRLKAGDATELEVEVNGVVLGHVRRSVVKRVLVDGRGGADTLTVDFANGAFQLPDGVRFVGGLGADKLVVRGSPDTDVFVQTAAGFTANGLRIDLRGVEAADLFGAAGDDVLTAVAARVPPALVLVSFFGEGGRDVATVTPGKFARLVVVGGADADVLHVRRKGAAVSGPPPASGAAAGTVKFTTRRAVDFSEIELWDVKS